MQSGRYWLGLGNSPQAGPSIWDLASKWGKGKVADKAASMALTAIGGPSTGIAAEAGKELLPQLFASLFNKGGDVQYKNIGGEIASLKEYLQELYVRADAGEGWANDEIEATLIKIKELEAPGFNKGGHINYKNHGGMMAGPLSEIKYKKTGGNVSDEITLKMAPLSKGE